MNCDHCSKPIAKGEGHELPCPDPTRHCSAFVCESCFIKGSADTRAALQKLSDHHWARLQEIEERLQELDRTRQN